MALYSSPDYQTFRESVGFWVQRKFKIDFQDSGYGSHLGFPIRTVLASFYLQVTSILPTNVPSSWPCSSGGEVQN